MGARFAAATRRLAWRWGRWMGACFAAATRRLAWRCTIAGISGISGVEPGKQPSSLDIPAALLCVLGRWGTVLAIL